MELFGLAFLLLLGFAEGQNGGIESECAFIEEEVLSLKQPLIAQLKTFAADEKFQRTWWQVFSDECYYDPITCELSEMSEAEKDPYGTEFRKRLVPFRLKAEILNATRNLEGIIRTHDFKLRRYNKRKYEILDRYYKDIIWTHYSLQPFDIFRSFSVNNYDSLADASRCQPCTNADVFSSCLYKELTIIKEGLAIFQEVAVSKRPVLMTETMDLLVKEFRKFPNITNEQIFDFFRNKFLIREYNRYISDVERNYDRYLYDSNKNFAINFTQTVQTVLEPAYMKNTCVGNVWKDVITQMKPFLTPDASTTKTLLPMWDFDLILSSYVQPTTETDINLIVRFHNGFLRYRADVFEDYSSVDDHYDWSLYRLAGNTYANLVEKIISKGKSDMYQCPDFGLVYGNSDFKDFDEKLRLSIYYDYLSDTYL